MSNLETRRIELKEQIRLEGKRLKEKKRKLQKKIKDIKRYVKNLEAFYTEFNQVTTSKHLTEIVTKGQLNTKVRPSFFKMSKYFVEKEIIQRINKTKREIFECQSEIEKTEEQQKNVKLCPDCHGAGQFKEVNYEREDGLIHPSVKFLKCLVCNGKGIIE